jgi:excisionase family DNA binding protein
MTKARPWEHELITVAAAAKRLQLHPKTVLRSIRDGRLRATRIGKSYRIMRADLDAFVGVPEPVGSPAERASLTAIIDVPGVGVEIAREWAVKIPAALKGRDPGDGPMRADVIYDGERSQLKVVLVGPAGDTSKLLSAIRVWLERLRS